MEEVESEDGAGLNTRDVAEGLDELLSIDIWVVDNQRSTALAVSPATHLSLSSTELAGFLNLDEIWTGSDVLEEGNGSLGLDDGVVLEGLGVNYEGNFGDVGNTVTTGEE